MWYLIKTYIKYLSHFIVFFHFFSFLFSFSLFLVLCELTFRTQFVPSSWYLFNRLKSRSIRSPWLNVRALFAVYVYVFGGFNKLNKGVFWVSVRSKMFNSVQSAGIYFSKPPQYPRVWQVIHFFIILSPCKLIKKEHHFLLYYKCKFWIK